MMIYLFVSMIKKNNDYIFICFKEYKKIETNIIQKETIQCIWSI